MRPDLLVLGQVTVDHAVPAAPAPWRETLGGNALYAAAGARLWVDPARVGIVARLGTGLVEPVQALLREAGLATQGLQAVATEPLVEWLLYEEDGSRRSLPRNPRLREAAADPATLRARYLAHLEALSPAAEDVPEGWLPARALHLAPQVASRHGPTVTRLRGAARFIAVDPSPHYVEALDEAGLARLLPGVQAFLPSRAEVAHLRKEGEWAGIGVRLRTAGFPEVVLKLGDEGCLVAAPGLEAPQAVRPAPATVVDPTGAGDAFCGGYVAARLLGLAPVDAARRATVSAAMVIECAGAAAALRLSPKDAERRLAAGPAPGPLAAPGREAT